jgi:hypothetical protein
VNETKVAKEDLSEKGSITSLEIVSDAVDSFLTSTITDSLDYRVRGSSDKPSMTVTGKAPTQCPNRVPVVGQIKSMLSDCSEMSDEEYAASKPEPLPIVDIFFEYQKAPTATGTNHRCIRKVYSNVAMNPAA